MRPERVLDHLTPKAWVRVSARRAFANATERAADDDVQLSASQLLGVVPQAHLMEAEDQKYMLALSGTENFKHVEPDDFVISLRSFEGGFEHSAYRGCVSPAYTVLRPRQRLDPRYFRHLFKSHLFRQMLAAFNVGVRDGKSIRYEDFSEFLLALPPIDQQGRIADFLDRETARIDALIEKKSRFIELLREKRKALVTKVVSQGVVAGRPMRGSSVPSIGDVPAEWVVRPFKYCVAYQEGPGIMAADFRDDGVPLLRISCVQSRTVTLEGCNYLEPTKVDRQWAHFRLALGDLLISGSASIGVVSEVGDEAAGSVAYTGLIRLRGRVGVMRKEFIRWLVMSDVFLNQIDLLKAGATIQHFGPTHLDQVQVPCPPLDEQFVIARYLDAQTGRLDQLAATTERSIMLLQERRAAIITAAVSGQIDIRAEQSAEDLEPA